MGFEGFLGGLVMTEAEQDYNKEVAKVMIKLGRAMKNKTGTRFTADEIQTLMLTSIGEDAAIFLHFSEEGGETNDN